MSRIAFLVFTLFLGSQAFAIAPVLDADVFYFSDTLTYNSQTSTYTRTMYDVMLGLPLNKKGTWVLGWNYDNMAFKDKAADGTTTSLTVTDMGPKILVYLDKERTWALSASYNLITTGKYNGGSATTELRGSCIKAEAGYLPMMWENVYIGAKINYYKPSFKEEIVDEATLNHVSDSRAVIYPTFAFTMRFE
jgi:hypothetical protein